VNDANPVGEMFTGMSANGGRHQPGKKLSKTQKNLTDERSSQNSSVACTVSENVGQKEQFYKE